jgi:hypothetical protein
MYRENFKRKSLITLFINCILINILVAQIGNDSIKNAKETFDREYKAYTEALKVDNKEFPRRSSSYGPNSSKCLQKIAKLGMAALPYLMEKATETEDMSLSLSINIITKKAFTKLEWPESIPMDSRGEIKLYITWWESGRRLTPQQFSQRYSQWKVTINQGILDKTKEKSEEILALGIAALPLILEKVKQGDSELISIISKLTDKKVDPNSTVEQCISWWEQNKEDWLIPFPNKQPKANAGKDQNVKSGQVVQLDGSASTDEDKDSLTCQWKQISGSAVKLSDAKSDKPSFTAPKVDKETPLVFELVVNDGSPKKTVHPSCESGDSKPATVTITIKP